MIPTAENSTEVVSLFLQCTFLQRICFFQRGNSCSNHAYV